jgi:hypothetical protein
VQRLPEIRFRVGQTRNVTDDQESIELVDAGSNDNGAEQVVQKQPTQK